MRGKRDERRERGTLKRRVTERERKTQIEGERKEEEDQRKIRLRSLGPRIPQTPKWSAHCSFPPSLNLLRTPTSYWQASAVLRSAADSVNCTAKATKLPRRLSLSQARSSPRLFTSSNSSSFCLLSLPLPLSLFPSHSLCLSTAVFV